MLRVKAKPRVRVMASAERQQRAREKRRERRRRSRERARAMKSWTAQAMMWTTRLRAASMMSRTRTWGATAAMMTGQRTRQQCSTQSPTPQPSRCDATRRLARKAGKVIVKRRSRAAGEKKTRASLLGGEIIYLCELCGSHRGVKADGMKAHRKWPQSFRKRREMREMLLE
eukprot:6518130-Prymnesium_polylepis.1